jgi:hypothetical protein
MLILMILMIFFIVDDDDDVDDDDGHGRAVEICIRIKNVCQTYSNKPVVSP